MLNGNWLKFINHLADRAFLFLFFPEIALVFLYPSNSFLNSLNILVYEFLSEFLHFSLIGLCKILKFSKLFRKLTKIHTISKFLWQCERFVGRQRSWFSRLRSLFLLYLLTFC